MTDDFQLSWHVDVDSYPEWGSAPRKPLVQLDFAHKGEWMESVIGPDVVTGKPMVYHILRCELCIAIHAWPLPEPAALATYYAEQFYQVEKPDYVERYQRDYVWWSTCVHEPLLRQCQEALSRTGLKDEVVRFLDIGAGPGIALDCAKQLGWQTWGIEPNIRLCVALEQRGHYMIVGTLEESGLSCHGALDGRGADILYAYEVFEHQPCPEDFLLRCYDLLEEGGLLVCVVPNDYSPIQLAAQAKLDLPSYWLAPPQHLWYFSPKTLQLLLRRTGFQILDMRGTFPIDKFLLEEGRNYIGDDAMGRRWHTFRMQDELYAVERGQWAQREQEYRFNLTQRIGREIVCIARKRNT
mgnify:CR=1 FL=1